MNFGSRDNGRRPMPWNDGENGGFSSGRPWLPVHDKYKEINVEKDLASEHSVYKYFKALFELRASSDAFTTGTYEDITNGRDGMYVYKRTNGDETYVVVCNFEKENTLSIDIDCELVLSNLKKREICGKYKPYECAVYKCK